jgi:hypothetical protein
MRRVLLAAVAAVALGARASAQDVAPVATPSTVGATFRLIPQSSTSSGPPTLDPEPRKLAPLVAPPAADPIAALARGLDAAEEAQLASLVRRLGAGTYEDREATSDEIRERFGARAVPALLQAGGDLDPEVRLRSRELVRSVLLSAALDRAPGVGWLGVRWSASNSPTRGFVIRVHEALIDNPAHKGGVCDGDDIFLWNGEQIEDARHFIDLIQATPPGDVAALVIDRKGTVVRSSVKMGRRSFDPSERPVEESLRRESAERLFERWVELFRQAAKKNGGTAR